MTHDLDVLAIAIQLVRALGEGAVTHCRTRRVELLAANHRTGAAFWKKVHQACEEELARSGRLPAAAPVPPISPGHLDATGAIPPAAGP